MTDVMLQIRDGVEGLIQKQQELENRFDKRESDERKKGWSHLVGGVNADPSGYLLKMAAAQVYQREGHSDCFERAGLSTPEKKLILDVTRKAMDTGTGGAGGGYVVPPAYIAALIEMLRAKMVVVKAGATLMEGLTGSPVIIPKQLTSASGTWVGQNASISASDPSFGQVQMTPKTYAIRAQFSNLLNLLGNPAMEGIIRRDFAKVCGLEMDRVALRGSGSANQPLGLNGVSGLGSYTVGTGNGGDLTRQDLLKMVGVVEDQNALDGKLAFVMNPKVCRVLKNERIAQYSGQTAGEYIQYPLTDAALAKSLGLSRAHHNAIARQPHDWLQHGLFGSVFRQLRGIADRHFWLCRNSRHKHRRKRMGAERNRGSLGF